MLPASGCSEFSEQKALLSQVAALVPLGTEVTLLADREYGSVAVWPSRAGVWRTAGTWTCA